MSKKNQLQLDEGVLANTPVDVMNIPPYPWRTQFNFDPLEQRQKKGMEPSVTVPGQSMSMSEIIKRYQEGRPLIGRVTSFAGYDLEEELPDLRKMDLAEIQELKEQNDAKLAELHHEMTSKQRQLKELAELNARNKWFEQETEKRKSDKEKREAPSPNQQ